MNKAEFGRQLEPIRKLIKLSESYDTGDKNEMVGLGLLTEAELAEYRRVDSIDSETYNIAKAAEDSVPRPTPYEEYPKEYKQILKRIAELEPDIIATTEARELLHRYGSSRGNHYSDSTTRGIRLGIDKMIDKAEVVFLSLPGEGKYDNQEYLDLIDKKERRNREGTIVQRINNQMFREWRNKQAQVRDAAVKSFKELHQEEYKTKYYIEFLINKRRNLKQSELARQIQTALNEVIAQAKGAK